jgi:hypothetical protein
MKYTPEQIKAARKVLVGLRNEERRLSLEPQAKDSYWNGDAWGSISGIRDAEDWVSDRLAAYLLMRVAKL